MGIGLFWGTALIVLGVSLILKVVFKLDFPLLKVFFAFVFIYFGVKLLIGNFGTRQITSNPNDVAFGERSFKYDTKIPPEQNVVFGRVTIDLRNLKPESLPEEIKINTIFGECNLLLSKSTPVDIKVDAAFAGASLPNDNSTAFGTSLYLSPGYENAKPHLTIRVNAVFAGFKVHSY